MEEVTILCVDDEQSILDALRRLFRKEEYELLLAASAEEGLQILEQKSVDLILADHRMPGLSGIDLLRRARVLQPEAVRIVLSGYTDVDALTAAINEGEIYRFISKPWNNEELKITVRRSLEGARLAARNKELSQAIKRQNEELRDLNESLELRVAARTRDLTLRTESLLLSQRVLDSLPIAVAGIDNSGLIVLLNERADSLHLFDGELAVGELFDDLLPEAITTLVRETMASRETRRIAEWGYGGPTLRVICSPFCPNGN
ncbi:MAG: response regulator, partial [Chloroflexota bacterium]